MSLPYEFRTVDTFARNLKDFNKANQTKIIAKIKDSLGTYPNRHAMFEGPIFVAGKKLFGLRHVKVGVKGHKGGAYIAYRICEECLEHEYWKKSKVKCQFCDPKKLKRVVLFDVRPRGFDYGR